MDCKHQTVFVSMLICLTVCFAKLDGAVAGGLGTGGGDFTVPLFWNLVEGEIIPRLKELREQKNVLLSASQIDLLIARMDRKKTNVELSLKPLFLIKADGTRKPVDALNYPTRSKIQLFKTSWQSMVNMGVDMNHLIVHEFMGLEQINDQDGLSAKLFPPRRKPISFAADKVVCSVATKYVKVKARSWWVRDFPPQTSEVIQLSSPKKLNPNPQCSMVDSKTGQCLQYVADSRVKEGVLRLQVPFDDGDDPGRKYFIEASVYLVSDYYGHGTGAAAKDLFLRLPEFQVVWKLIEDRGTEGEVTLNMATSYTSQRNEYSDAVSLLQNLPMADFTDLLEKNGFMLRLVPYDGEVTDLFHSFNIVGFLESTGKEAGFENVEQRDAFILDRVLVGAKGNAIPFRIFVECSLLPDDGII